MKPEIEYVYNKLKRLRFDFNSSDFRDFRSYYRYDPELMRYVRKDDNDLFIAKDTFKPLEEELEYADKCHNLEEQLGCPLEVVIEALKYGIYTKESELDKELELYEVRGIGLRGLEVISKICSYGECDFACYYTDYKKTWWLKEDKSE